MVLPPIHNMALTVYQTPNSIQERNEALDETADQVALMFRRFDAAGCGKPCAEILAENDRVKAFKRVVKIEIFEFITKTGSSRQ